jgi:hypothetical protein
LILLLVCTNLPFTGVNMNLGRARHAFDSGTVHFCPPTELSSCLPGNRPGKLCVRHLHHHFRPQQVSRPSESSGNFQTSSRRPPSSAVQLWTANTHFLVKIGPNFLLITGHYSHKFTPIIEEEGPLVIVRIFSLCPCAQPTRLPDKPHYYINFD